MGKRLEGLDYRQCNSLLIIWPCNEDNIEWAAARGLKIVAIGDEYMALRIPYKCPHFKYGHCNLEDNGHSKVPRWCRKYPSFFQRNELRNMGFKLEDLTRDINDI